MPKSTNEKNKKGSQKPKSVASKKTAPKKVDTKKVETKKEEVKKVEVKQVVVETTKKEKKGKCCDCINIIKENTPFAISLCVIIVLIIALVTTLLVKRVPKTSKGKQVVATLNGKKITADDLYVSLKDSYGTDTLINLIDKYIVSKEVTVTEEDKKYVDEVVNYYKDYAEYYGVDLATFLSSYAGLNGISTEKEFYNFVLEDYKKTLAVQKFIGDAASEKDLKDYYKENYSDKLTVRHILIEVDQEAEDATKADKEAYDKAVDLIKTLDKTSEKKLESKFKKLAEDNSDDTGTYSNGGLIEDFSKKDVQESFWNAAYELEDGKYTAEPIKTSYGYHIILKESSTPVEKYKDIKDDVKKAYAESLLANDANLMVQKWDELRNQYKLNIKDDVIKKSYKSTIKTATDTNNETEEK